MKARALLFSALFLALATTASAAPSTALNDSTNLGNFDNGIITPQTIIGYFGNGVTSDTGTAYGSFEVPGGYGYVKIYFKNNSSAPLKVIVTHDDTNKTYVEKTISGGGSYTWLSTDDNPQGVRAGKYKVTFRGGGDGSKPVDASYRGFATDNTADF